MRNLRVLRIDDEATPSTTSLNPFSIATSPLLGMEAFDGLEFEHNRTTSNAIFGWSSALSYWKAFKPDMFPDLIVSDVNFQLDESSPMQRAHRGSNRPSGLSHLKPFAALSRASNRVIGVGLHTADANTWRGLTAKNDANGLWAAAEIGEIAAILDGETPSSNSPQLTDQQLEWCWAWLRNRSESRFDQAWKKALGDYRNRVINRVQQGISDPARVSVYISVNESKRLLHWLHTEEEKRVGLSPNNDPGLTLSFEDRPDDSISLCSLFSDFNDDLRTCYDPKMFDPDSEYVDDPHDGIPRVAAFINSVSHLERVYDDACKIHSRYSVSFEPGHQVAIKLQDVAKEENLNKLSVMVAVLFMAVRVFRYDIEKWKDMATRLKWNEKELKFCDDEDSTTLASFLRRLKNKLREFDGSFTAAEAFECFDDRLVSKGACPKWFLWHLQYLALIGELRAVIDDGTYTLTDRLSNTLNPLKVPAQLPIGTTSATSNIASSIGDQFGYGQEFGPGETTDYNYIGRVFSSALLEQGATPKQGRDLLYSFTSGACPSWLNELCEAFATSELGWNSPAHWPDWMGHKRRDS